MLQIFATNGACADNFQKVRKVIGTILVLVFLGLPSVFLGSTPQPGATTLPRSSVELDLGAMVQPVPATAMFSDPKWDIWCGAPIKGDDGKYHLFYSRWPAKDGFDPGWAIHSEIAYAVADQPLGPYRFVNVALPARGINPATGKEYWDGEVTHNPNILRQNGRYYLFYMGNHGPGDYAIHRNNQRIGVAVADRPEGPWKRFDHPIIDVSANPADFDSLCVTNPAATVRPDGSILLIYKGVTQQAGNRMGGAVRFGAALAGSPEGPYIKQQGHIFELAQPDRHTWMLAEDPYIWFSRSYGMRYYAIARDAAGYFSGSRGGVAMFQSEDGLHWQPTLHPKVLGNSFLWADGHSSGRRIERPALLFDGDRPIALFGATNGYLKPPQTSCNVQIPLRWPSD
jgi:hypothetical protein